MKYIAIVAMGRYREIGRKGRLLWKLPRDMQFFKETTMGHTVVMGRKSWDSLPKSFRPLPGRKNIVITRNRDFQAEGATIISDLRDIEKIVPENEKKCFIIGGAQIYQLALDYGIINEMYITHVDERFPNADTFYPFINWDHWDSEEILTHPKDEENPYSITIKRYIL